MHSLREANRHVGRRAMALVSAILVIATLGLVSATPAFADDPDITPPAVTCGTADGIWHADNVTIDCTATDAESGLASEDQAFTLTTTVTDGTATATAATDTRNVCDLAGNCATAGPVTGNQIDRSTPTISTNIPPAPFNVFPLGTLWAAGYNCADTGSGMASCLGNTPPYAMADTSTPGIRTLTVDATDNVGNTSTKTVTYEATEDLVRGQVLDRTKPGMPGLAGVTIDWLPVGSDTVAASVVTDATGS